MGVVYRGFDPTIGRTVAIKTVLLETADPDMLKRFRREAQAAGILSHPNIVTMYDAGEEEGIFYIAMELVEGETLQQMLAHGPLPVERVIPIAEQVGAALDHAHSREIIHRDIKPANIMVSKGCAKVMDFGVAKIISVSMTSTGQVLGTPSYMSPELVKGANLDGRSDIFSLGVVLYEMLTGIKPFTGDSITTVIYKIIGEQPEPPAAINSSLALGLNYVVLKALAKAPAERYQNCAELTADLKNHRALVEKGMAAGRAAAAAIAAAPHEATGTVVVDRKQLKLPPEAPAPQPGGEARPSRKKSLLAVAAAALLALAIGVLWQMWRSPEPASSPGDRAGPSPSSSPSSPPPGARTVKPPSGAKKAAPLTRALSVAPREAGRVSIHTTPPGARILVNGKTTDYRSPVNIALAPGTYKITAEQPGFASETREVVIRKNQMLQLNVGLKPSGGKRRLFPFR